jgi:pantoate--beta-alanine ligase
MKIFKDATLLQTEILNLKSQSDLINKKSIGFVPTLGGLHNGHLSLIDRCIEDNDFCIVSIFLNPTQFNNANDYENYPSSLQEDLSLLKNKKVDILFLPNFETIYPDNYKYEVIEKELSLTLCGKSRPGHFSGVLTVVLKLLNIAQAHKAYFGEKDFQQFKLIEDMAKAFFIPTQIIALPTVRDTLGLALSSRNKRLSPLGLAKAQRFAQIIKDSHDKEFILNKLALEQIEIDYFEEINNRRFVAVNIENVRLIDNVPI